MFNVKNNALGEFAQALEENSMQCEHINFLGWELFLLARP